MPRPAKSNEHHKAKGTYRPCRHSAAPQEVLKSLPSPPAWLSDRIAKDAWKQFGNDLVTAKILTRLDLGALASLCEAWSSWRSALATIAKEGQTFDSESGEPRKHPAVTIAEKSHATILAIQDKLGLTPSSRQRLRVEPSGDGHDELDKFIEG